MNGCISDVRRQTLFNDKVHHALEVAGITPKERSRILPIGRPRVLGPGNLDAKLRYIKLRNQPT